MSHCNSSHSSPTHVHCFDNGYVKKQSVAWRKHCEQYWLKELLEGMDRCSGCCDITEILLKMTINTIQSIDFWNSNKL